MASYTTLTSGKEIDGSIQNWVNRADIPVTEIVTEAEALIYQKLRVRDMMVRDDFAVSADESEAILPTDFLDPITLVPYGWGVGLDYQNESIFVQHMDSEGVIQDGTPGAFTVVGSSLIFDVNLLEAFGGKLTYYARPMALSGGNPTNFLTVRYPTLLRHACMSFAYEHMKDEQRSLDYRKKAEAEAVEASIQDELFRRAQR